MNVRPRVFVPIAVAALGALLALRAPAQDRFASVRMRAVAVAPGEAMLMGAGGNIGVFYGPDGVVLIDDQFAPLSEKITAAIARLTAKPVKFILNTHWHYDHTGGNENFGKSGAIIVAHENVRKRMSSEQFIEFMRTNVPAAPQVALPLVTFASSVSFFVNGEELRAIHVAPAHTDGDAIVRFVKSDVIHMGDTYFNGMYPFIDTSSGGTVEGVIAACDRALALASNSTRIIPGHGPLSNKAELKAYRDMLSEISGRIRKMIDSGSKLEDITSSKVSADYDEKWGKGFIPPSKFAEMVAMNILKNR